MRRIPRRRLHIVDGFIDDGCGNLKAVWFNQRWLGRRLEDEPELYLYGQIRKTKGGGVELINPEIEKVEDDAERIVPIYRRIGRFGGRRLRNLIGQCLEAVPQCPDPLPEAIRREYGLSELGPGLRELHAPVVPSNDDERHLMMTELGDGRRAGHRRLAFDELLAFACTVTENRDRREGLDGPLIKVTEKAEKQLCELLPFRLTDAQRRVVREISADLGRSRPMARLVQGDVGSGKTAVAAVAMAMALEAGFQVAIMAPTELLAEQHLRTLDGIFTSAGYPPRLLVGSLTAAERRAVNGGLADGSLRLVIGTHALFQESVEFHRLGLVVVDEQHRFGVVQRSALVAKGASPHLLVMTATPIPRSLALTVYGDLELSVIDEMPPGRQPVRTVLRPASARAKVFDFIRTELGEGGRAFIVCPFIDPNEDIPVAAVSERFEDIRNRLQGFDVGILHGRLSSHERDEVSAGFRDGSIQVLLATTVIEVGVDVPEATIMVIESAQHFGLSQLHQLRGRVGRGCRPAWCILLTDGAVSEDARRRLGVVCRSVDGFEIAEADLEIRGPGELMGTRQWGPAAFRFANLVRDLGVIGRTRDLAAEFSSQGKLKKLRRDLGLYHPIESGFRAS